MYQMQAWFAPIRDAVCIHVHRSGESAWFWELRTPAGAVITDSASDGEYVAFTNKRDAFNDAASVAYHRMVRL